MFKLIVTLADGTLLVSRHATVQARDRAIAEIHADYAGDVEFVTTAAAA